MKLFTIADLHLSLGEDKPMDVFHGWDDYVDRLKENWIKLVSPEDTVVIVGDISWAMKLNECYEDFAFIHSLPGTKILIKGNHDLWWQTKKKLEDYLAANGFDSIRILYNNAFEVGDYAVCGSRGWYFDSESEQDRKVLLRECGRIRTSIAAAKATGKKPVLFLHYPPVFGGVACDQIMDIIIEEGIEQVYYGHLHGERTHRSAVIGEYRGVDFHLISCDYTRFIPILVR